MEFIQSCCGEGAKLKLKHMLACRWWDKNDMSPLVTSSRLMCMNLGGSATRLTCP